MKAPINVIVTGSNRGIGKAICELILSKQGHNNDRPLKLFAASRKGEDFGLGGENVSYPKLDISSQESIDAFAKSFAREGQVDVLINNAGINLDNDYNLENAKQTMDVNYRGTLKMCQAIIPLLSQQGRIVNMSSVGSILRPYGEHMRERFRDPNMSLADLEQLAREFIQAVQDKTEEKSGFGDPRRSYSVSKSCVNAFTRILAKEHPGLIVNACCPGWVDTDMGMLVSRKTRPPKMPIEGAAVPYKLAFDDIGDVTGAYWANDNVRSKESGHVQEW